MKKQAVLVLGRKGKGDRVSVTYERNPETKTQYLFPFYSCRTSKSRLIVQCIADDRVCGGSVYVNPPDQLHYWVALGNSCGAKCNRAV
jgi:hypothetical protein